MRTLTRLSLLSVMFLLPVFSASAFIAKPDIQFRTFEEIQQQALEKLEIEENSDDPEVKRRAAILKAKRQKSRFKRSSIQRNSNLRRSSFKNKGKSSVKRSFTRNAPSQSAVERKQKLSLRDRIRARLEQRRKQNRRSSASNLRRSRAFTNTERRSSFDFVPLEGQLWR